MRLVPTLILAVALLAWPTSAGAQTPCRFVLGFAALYAQLGPAVAGECMENQRTLTGKEDFVLSEKVTVRLPVGAAVQRTTAGVLSWLPQPNLTEFADANGSWMLVADGVAFKSWSQINAESNPAPNAPPPAQTSGSTPYTRASALCFQVASGPTLESVTASPARARQLQAEAEAADYLCGKALDEDGPRGVDCFSSAWDASRGMERVFAGSGMRVYDEKYRACLAGR